VFLKKKTYLLDIENYIVEKINFSKYKQITLEIELVKDKLG